MTPSLTLLTVLMTSSLSLAAPWYGSRQVVARQQCSVKYEVRTETVCSTRYEEQCRQEYDTVLDTVYVDQCRDVVSQHCSPVPAKFHRGYGKREAEPGYGHGGYSVRPVCRQKVERRCEKVPQQESRQVARPVCVAVEVKVPYKVCGSSHVSRSQYSHGYRH